MAHLRKLADQLKRRELATVREIIQAGTTHDSVLEQTCPFTTHITRKLNDLVIPSLKLTAAEHSLGALAAPQIGFPASVFVLHRGLVKNQWAHYKAAPRDYRAYINPRILSVTAFEHSDWEECSSVPGIRAKVLRPSDIKVEYLNEEGEFETEDLRGFHSRVFQHETEHTWGFTIINYSVCDGNLQMDDPQLNNEVSGVLEKYKKRIEKDTQTLAQRYECDTQYRAQAELSGDPAEFFQRQVADQEFEEEFKVALCNAIWDSKNNK